MKTRQKRAVIGIVPSFDTGEQFLPISHDERQYARREYSRAIAAVGAVPVLLTPDTPLDYITSTCDGVVISGGQNIDPKLYGQLKHPNLDILEPKARFRWERKLIKACDKSSTPILGICYGMQVLNVHYGGTLIQDIDSYIPENVGHFLTEHPIRFHTDFLGMKSMGVHTINSRHHQAIDQIAEGFQVVADAPDGIIEAIEGHGHFGIQWHPESDETGAHIYRAFIEHCLGFSEPDAVY